MNSDSLARQNAEVLRHAKAVMDASVRIQQKCRALEKRVDDALLRREIPITARYIKKPAKRKDNDRF